MYGISLRFASASPGPRPMKRLTEAMVSRGEVKARLCAARPTTH